MFRRLLQKENAGFALVGVLCLAMAAGMHCILGEGTASAWMLSGAAFAVGCAAEGLRGRSRLVLPLALWAIYALCYLPVFVFFRRTGLTDIGRTTLLFELLGLRQSFFPLSRFAGGLIAGTLLLGVLSRVPQRRFAHGFLACAFLPLMGAGVTAFYSAQASEIVTAIAQNIAGVIAPMGMGAAMTRWGMTEAGENRLRCLKLPVRSLLCLTGIGLSFAGMALLPKLVPGRLQLVGNRIDVALPMELLAAPALVLSLCALFGCGVPKAPAREPLPGRGAPRPAFDRDTTAILKGIALIMMFMHHALVFPEWMAGGLTLPTSEGFQRVFRLPLAICMPAFAFLTGYFYEFRREKTLRYSLGKIVEILIANVCIFLPMRALSLAFGTARPTIGESVLELVGLRFDILIFGWYVGFYIVAMLALPLLDRLPVRGFAGTALVYIALPVVLATWAKAAFADSTLIVQACQNVLDGICPLGAGVVAARFYSPKREKDTPGELVVYVCLLIAVFFGRYFGPRVLVAGPNVRGEALSFRLSMDAVYAPVFVLLLARLITLMKPGWLRRGLAEIGKYSMHMWIISCVFFNHDKQLLQPLLYAPKNAVLIVLWGLLLCYIAARIVDIPIRMLTGAWKRRIKY